MADDLLDATRLAAGKLDMALAQLQLEAKIGAAVDTVVVGAAQAAVHVERTPGCAVGITVLADGGVLATGALLRGSVLPLVFR